jgi:hypothetical protein
MNRKFLKKMTLIGGILLLLMIISGQPALAKLDIEKEDQLIIFSVIVEFVNDDIVLHIDGQNFVDLKLPEEEQNPPTVTLNGEDCLVGDVVFLPENVHHVSATCGIALAPGDYLLYVYRGVGTKQEQVDQSDLTIGAVGPEGPQGEQGPSGAAISLGPVTETDPAGGEGGSSFGPLDCPTDMVGVGFRGRAGDDIDRTELFCATVNRSLFGVAVGSEVTGGYAEGPGGTSYGDVLMCPSNSALIGVRVRAGLAGPGFIIDQLGSRCRLFSTGEILNIGLVGLDYGSASIIDLDCPDHSVVTGFSGRQGLVLDQIQLRCRSTTN